VPVGYGPVLEALRILGLFGWGKIGVGTGVRAGAKGIDCISAEGGNALACGDGVVVAMDVVMVVKGVLLAGPSGGW
jgi:hypothetical protein